MRPAETKLQDDAVAEWENEGGTSQSPRKQTTQVDPVAYSVFPIVSTNFFRPLTPRG
jgi:hypothetical protein